MGGIGQEAAILTELDVPLLSGWQIGMWLYEVGFKGILVEDWKECALSLIGN